MKILYVYPHPDDESFGPALAIAGQSRAGHEVHLLTLTRGGATKVRRKLGYSVDRMGEVRARELARAADVLGIRSLEILDFPDSRLAEVDPRKIESAVRERIRDVMPVVVVTYPVHGISGFPDHIVTHAAVKRVFCELRGGGEGAPRRLACNTIDEASAREFGGEHALRHTAAGGIDCWIRPGPEDDEAFRKALDCYETYQEMIDRTGIRRLAGRPLPFEFFQEDLDPPVDDLGHGLRGGRPGGPAAPSL